MESQIILGHWIQVQHANGLDFIHADLFNAPESLTPADVLEYTGAEDVDEIESIIILRNRYGVRLSIDGALDCTKWELCGTRDAVSDAVQQLIDEDEDYMSSHMDVLMDDWARDPDPVLFMRPMSEGEPEPPVCMFTGDINSIKGLLHIYQSPHRHGMGVPHVFSDSTHFQPARRHAPDVDTLRTELEAEGYALAEDWIVWTHAEGLDPGTERRVNHELRARVDQPGLDAGTRRSRVRMARGDFYRGA